MKTVKTLVAVAIAALSSTAALADINIGVSLSLTGPGSGLGIPMQNQFKLFPTTIAGEKVNLIILDDASDPGKGAANARRFVTEDKVDLIIGSCLTPVAAAMTPVATEAKTVQLAASPVGVPPGADQWMFRLPQGNDVMAHAMVEHMKKQNIKTIGFLGYTDAYGELWLKALTPLLDQAGIKIVATERFARTDTSVTPQALKLTSANPDAMLIVASGSGAASSAASAASGAACGAVTSAAASGRAGGAVPARAGSGAAPAGRLTGGAVPVATGAPTGWPSFGARIEPALSNWLPSGIAAIAGAAPAAGGAAPAALASQSA